MEWWLSVISMVMLWIIARSNNHFRWAFGWANLSQSLNQNLFNRTNSGSTNGPILDSNPVIPSLTCGTPDSAARKKGRKSRQFQNVERRTYHPELKKCPICSSDLRLRNYLNWRKHVQTLTENLHVSSRGAYCHACEHDHFTYLSAKAQNLSLPNSTYGLDILVRIGYLRDYYRLPYARIQEQLPPHIQVSARHLQNLYKEYLALLACAERLDLDKLKEAVKVYGGLIYAVDGLEPEGGQPQLWSVREVLTGTLIAAGWVTRVNQDTLCEFLAPVKALNLPLLAILSDKQPSLVLALQKTWKDTPHQFCQAHYLTNAADPLYKVDQQMKTQLRKQVRANAGPTMREAQAKVQKKATERKDPLVITGLAAQPPEELDEIRQLAFVSESENKQKKQSIDPNPKQPARMAPDEQVEQSTTNHPADDPDLDLDPADPAHISIVITPPENLTDEPDEPAQNWSDVRLELSPTTVELSAENSVSTIASVSLTQTTSTSVLDHEWQQSESNPVTKVQSTSSRTGSELIDCNEQPDLPPKSSELQEPAPSAAILAESASPTPVVSTQVERQEPDHSPNANGAINTESVADMIRVKLAETPVVLFNRKSPKQSTDQADEELPQDSKNVDKQNQIDELVATYATRLRRVLSVSGRKPYHFAGLRLYGDLLMLLSSLENSLEYLPNESRLECFAESIRQALLFFEESYCTIAEGYSWLLDISAILDAPLPLPLPLLPASADTETIQGPIGEVDLSCDLLTVRERLEEYLDWLKGRTDLARPLIDFRDNLCQLTTRYAPGLFHCYEIAGLPRTNNGLESHFGALRWRTFCTVGPYRGQQLLHETGAWLLLDVISDEHEQLRRLQKVPLDNWRRERERMQQHHQKATDHRRFRRDPKTYLASLEAKAAAISAL